MILVSRNFILLIFMGLLAGSLNGMQPQPNVQMTVFDLVQAEHTSAIDDSTQKQPFRFKEKNADGTPYSPTPDEYLRFEFEMQLYPPFSAQFSQACGLLKDSGYFPQAYEHLEIDGATREDLKILRGPQRGRNLVAGEENSEFDCLANKVNNTRTAAGKAVLCTQLVKPPSAIEQLISRNLKINALLALHRDSQNQRSLNPNFNSVETHLKNAADGESMYLAFFDPKDNYAEQLRRSKRTLLGAEKIAWIKKFENWLNDNPLYLYWQEAQPIIMSAPAMVLGNAVKVWDLGKIFFGPDKVANCVEFCKKIGIEAINPIDMNAIGLVGKFSPKSFVGFLKCVFAAKGIEDQINGISNTKLMLTCNLLYLKYMRKKLHHASKMICALKDAETTLQRLKSYNNDQMIVDLQMPRSSKAKETIEILSSSTFEKDHEGLWLVHWGKIKLAYKRMCETKDEFKRPYAALAELDYLMGSTRLIIDNPTPLIRDSNQKAKYCLPTFTRDAQTPGLRATKCWNPFIKNGQRVVLNDVELGPEGKKMLIITGPNRQGKTVYLAMILYATLMSQALGVTPAQELSHTPYNHLITFMKGETDTSKGESLFVNICKRAKACMNIVQDKPGFKLFGTDEPFNGTKHLLTESTVYEYLKPIGTHPHVNGMITTHLKAATRLPAHYRLHFTNLKVNNHRVEAGIGHLESEAEGLRIIAEELGPEFADAVKKNIRHQGVHEYLENQTNLDRLVQEARQEHNALRQQVGVPTLDGMVANLADPRLRADWEQAINNPSIAEIHRIVHRLRHPNFDNFFDLLERVAVVSSVHPDTHQQTFKDLMLTIMAHCADATSTAHSAPWLTRIQQVEASIAQEHERRAKLQQEINALLSVRNEEPLEQQLQTERHTLATLTQKKQDTVDEIDDIERELHLMQRLRQLQMELEQQDQEFMQAIRQTRAELQPLLSRTNQSSVDN